MARHAEINYNILGLCNDSPLVTHQAIARLIYANIYHLPNEKVNDLEVSNTHCFEFEY